MTVNQYSVKGSHIYHILVLRCGNTYWILPSDSSSMYSYTMQFKGSFLLDQGFMWFCLCAPPIHTFKIKTDFHMFCNIHQSRKKTAKHTSKFVINMGKLPKIRLASRIWRRFPRYMSYPPAKCISTSHTRVVYHQGHKRGTFRLWPFDHWLSVDFVCFHSSFALQG